MEGMNMASALDISASGLAAQRLKMNVIANNLANAHTTNAGTVVEDGVTKFVPYRRKEVVFQIGMPGHERDGLGVSATMVVDDPSPFREEQNPHHQHAVNGVVRMPNVDPMIEMVDMIAASRAYEANVTAIEATKGMGMATMRIIA